jgi:hypothetical protein
VDEAIETRLEDQEEEEEEVVVVVVLCEPQLQRLPPACASFYVSEPLAD